MWWGARGEQDWPVVWVQLPSVQEDPAAPAFAPEPGRLCLSCAWQDAEGLGEA